MITSIEITNCKSIKKAKLDFTKSKYQYLPQYVLNESVANPIAIYGHNGSGKSSFWEAIQHMVKLLTWDRDALIPFLYCYTGQNQEKIDDKAGISILFLLKGNRYCYSIYTATEGICDEKLTVNDETVFSRDLHNIKFNNGVCNNAFPVSFYPALRTLFNDLSSNNRSIKDAYEYLSNFACISACKQQYLAKSLKNQKLWDAIEEKSGEVKDVLETYKSFPLYNIIPKIENGQKVYYASVDIGEKKKMVLPYDYISQGMHNQSVLLTLLLTMPKGGVLLVDELEVALHPATIMNFIDLVVKKNIQLIFTSHNTFILSKLRPDNVVFAHWEKGCSSFSRLSDIYPNIREINNIEKMYLSSTFDEEIEKAR